MVEVIQGKKKVSLQHVKREKEKTCNDGMKCSEKPRRDRKSGGEHILDTVSMKNMRGSENAGWAGERVRGERACGASIQEAMGKQTWWSVSVIPALLCEMEVDRTIARMSRRTS